MAVKIRLRVQGKKNRAFYRIVVADARMPRDGKFIEKLGWFNPFDENQKAELDAERLQYWLSVGAELSPKVKAIAKKYQPEVVKAHTQTKVKVSKKAAK